MLVDFQHSDSPTLYDFDIAIVGAGAAGMTLAAELSNNRDLAIGVLESGHLNFHQPTQSLYNIQTSGLPYFEPDGNRLRFFGGSTNHWSRQVVPIEDNIFTRKKLNGISSWPLSKDILLPYYLKAYKQLGFDISRPITHNPESLFPELPWINFRPDTFRNTLRYVPKVDLPRQFRTVAEKAQNITVVLNANVTGLSLREGGKSLQDCALSTLDKRKVGKVTARIFVIACGGIENPRLLLMSNRQETSGIGNQNGFVGKFFMEHPHILSAVSLYSSNDALKSYGYHDLETMAYVRGIELTPEYQKAHGLLSVTLTWLPESADDFAKLHNQNQYYVGVQSEQAPYTESRVSLSETKDALDCPKTNVNWQVTDLESKTITQAVKLLASELGRLGLARVKFRQVNPDAVHSVTGWQGGAHHMGTTRMAKDASEGVVDTNLKVFGIDNLYISGSSVFPTAGYANPTLTIIALSHRLAEHLTARLARC